MFRIKTDIRHYRCDNRDKVERLIRNWVIRPADLIYDPDGDSWQPIGQHPTFVALFDELAERHDNEPNTVVTPEVADKAAEDRAVKSDVSEDTQPNGASSTPKAAVLRRPSKDPAPPEPSDNVIGVIRDSDEITMMTEKTLDLLTESAEEDQEPAQTAAEEPTQLIERPEFDDDDDDQAQTSSPAKVVIAEGAEEARDVEEPTQPFERPEFDDDEDDVQSEDHREDEKPLRRPNRHNLPEEVFATAEIQAQKRDNEEERLDELAALERGEQIDEAEGEEDSPMGSAKEARSNWNIILDEMPPPDDEESSPSDDDALRDTADLEPVDRDDAAVDETDEFESDDPEEEDLRDTADLELPATDKDSTDEDSTDEETPNLRLDEDALDEAFEDLEESAIAARQAQEEAGDDEPVELQEIGILEELPPAGVNLGYEVDLPIHITPSQEALKSGLQRTKKAQKLKDRLYPRPKQKEPGVVEGRCFDLSHKPSELPVAVTPQTLAIAGVVLVLVLTTVGIAAC